MIASTPASLEPLPLGLASAGPAAATPPAADEALFRQLVHDHQHRLYRFVVKHIGWGTDAEDLTQQAFVEAAQSYASFKGASELSTWLYERTLGEPPTNRITFSKGPAAG